jgi:hypothetical protein
MGSKRRSLRVARRLKQLHLSWLLIPWHLVLAARFFFLPSSWRRLAADEEQAVGLYRRLSGTGRGWHGPRCGGSSCSWERLTSGSALTRSGPGRRLVPIRVKWRLLPGAAWLISGRASDR